MKIRTDFVTNSSSYNSCVIRIDNPVLEEIFKKYKDGCLFSSKRFDYICKDDFAVSFIATESGGEYPPGDTQNALPQLLRLIEDTYDPYYYDDKERAKRNTMHL